MYGLPRVRAITAVAVVLIQLLSVGVLPGVQETRAQESQTRQVAPDRYIVRLKDTQNGFTSAASVASSYNAKPGVKVDQVYSNLFNGFAGEFSSTAAAALLKDPNVQDVFPDGISTLQAQYDLPGVQRVGADLNPTHAGNGSGSVNVDVAVIDTGVAQHADLNVYRGKDCTIGPSRSDAYHDYIGHGTHVAGSVGAMDNGVGVVGVAPGARIWAVKVFSDGQSPEAAITYDSEVICGLDYVRANAGSIDVVNLSIGGYVGYDIGGCSATAYHQAYCRVVDAGVTVVVAAGNSHQDSRYFVPAQFNEVITVSAYYDTDGQPGGLGPSYYSGYYDDNLAYFSNYGADVDIAAPGVDILSTASPLASIYEYCDSAQPQYCSMSGTSMAAPHVAGGAALVIAQQGQMSPASVLARLRLTGMPGGLPGDSDSVDEPLMNVAYLGKGSITAPATTEVGKSIQIRVGGFTPDTRVIFRFKGAYVGGDTVDDAGRGSRDYVVPEMAQGTYKATAGNGLKSVSKNVKVVSSITLSRASAPVQETVVVSLHGFASGETVLVEFDGRDMGTTTVGSNGFGQVSFQVPFSVGGWHTVRATGNKGNSDAIALKVAPTALVKSGDPVPGALVSIGYIGFKAGEVITFHYDSQTSAAINTPTETASSTGSGIDSVRIPSDSTPGAHYVWIIGNQGTKVRMPLSVSAAEAPEPTATATATTEPTGTPEPTVDAPTETPEPTIDVPTETATPESPTETPTVEAPTETPPTETPTELPTETPTTEPVTATATEEAAPIP